MRRVVVTGLGLLSPFGVGAEHSWKQILAGRSSTRRIERFEVDDLPCKIASPIPREGEGALQSRRLSGAQGPAQDRRVHPSTAWSQPILLLPTSGWKPQTEDERCAAGVMIGSGIGGIERHRGEHR